MTEQTEPGNWQISKSTRPRPKIANSKKVKSGLVNPVDSRLLSAFPVGRPFEQNTDMIQCKHCRKPIFKPGAPEHIRDCLKKKQEKAQKKKEAKEAKDAAQRKERNGGVSPGLGGGEDAKKSLKLGGGGDSAKKTSKKRKAEGEAGPKKKRKKDEPKAKPSRLKGPVDVERQCGVLMPNGQMCARSLTCKTHAMGLKRAVPGRSMRYDVLLANYQKKNHAKQHRKLRQSMMRPD
jgi:SAGA-associated factor 73